MAGELHAQFLDIFEHNLVAQPGALEVLGAAGRPLGQGQVRQLRHRRGHRPPHAVAGLLPDDAAARRRQHLRPQQRRAHPEPRQPARQPEGRACSPGPEPGPDAAEWRAGGHRTGRDLVGALGGLDDRARGREKKRPDEARQPQAQGRRRGPRPLHPLRLSQRMPATVRFIRAGGLRLRVSLRRGRRASAAADRRDRREHRDVAAASAGARRRRDDRVRRSRNGPLRDAAAGRCGCGGLAELVAQARAPCSANARSTSSGIRSAARSRSSSRTIGRGACGG